MASRDANELLTKDGSARVQLYKMLGSPLVFTMEMGYHGCPLKPRSEDNPFSGEYQRKDKIFTTEDYQQHGKSILIALYYLILLNAQRTLKQSDTRLLVSYREEICKELVEKEERFRQMDGLAFKKIKIVSELIQEQFY
jgi:hypothetical protein